jgi:SHS2 domain-containing protein
VEAFLLDFDENLYGETLGLSFVKRLRGEERFGDIGALIAQIRSDVERARSVLADPSDHGGIVSRGAPLLGGDPAWQELPHTADWAIRVTGVSQRQLFARAASAMYSLQDADVARPITLARAVSLNADSSADLLVGWLNALLLGQELGGELYTRFEITEISPRGLHATAYGYRGAPTHTAVKAVTYYDLSVEETPAGWSATVTFDV